MAAADQVVSGPLVVALPIAAAAGLVSFLSPCVLPLVPGYLAVLAGAGGTAGAPVPGSAGSRGGPRLLGAAALFVAGFSALFISYGALFGSIGATLRTHERTLEIVFGTLTILLGLAFCGLLDRVPLASREIRLHRSPATGLGGAPLVGVLFGLGWTPCIGPTLASVLGLAAATDGATAARGALLAALYCAGLGVPFLVAAVAYSRALRAFSAVRRHARGVAVVGGVMLVALGVAEISGAWNELVQRLQEQVGTVQLPL